MIKAVIANLPIRRICTAVLILPPPSGS